MSRLIAVLFILIAQAQVILIAQAQAASIRGIVKDPSGAVVKAATVELTPEGSKTTTDGEGRFSISNVAPGAHRIIVEASGFAREERTVEVADGGRDVELTIELKLSQQEVSVEVGGGKISALANSDPVYRSLRLSEPVPGESWKISKPVALRRDAAQFTFESGQFTFAPPVMGKIVYAVFTGKGSLKMTPVLTVESDYMARVLGTRQLIEEFRSAVLVFTDDTAAEIQKATERNSDGGGAANPAKDAWKEFRHRTRLRPEHPRSLVEALLTGEQIANIDAEILGELYNPRQAGSFQAYLHGQRFGDLRYIHSPFGALPQLPSPEESALIVYDPGGERESIAYLSHTIAEIARKTANSQENKRLVEAQKYKIETVIGRNDRLTSTADIEFKAQVEDVRVVKFGLLPTLRVNRVTIGERETPFLQESRKEDGAFYVILPQGMKRGDSRSLHVEYEGNKVVSKEGNGTYSIGARTAWYPSLNAFQDRAIYDLTFKIPKGNTLVSVGRLEQEWKESNYACTHWVTPVPVAVAGFNFGLFKKKSVYDDVTKYTIEGYATEEMPDYLKGRGFGSMAPSAMIQTAISDAQNSLRLYSSFFGALPYGRLALTMQPEFNFGQSWPSLVYLPVTAFLDGTQRWSLLGGSSFKFAEFIQEVTPHEVAHQWWGHELGWATYRDQWLSEGFADFSAGLFLQLIEKKQDRYLKFLEQHRERITKKNEWGASASDAGPLWMGIRLNTFKTGRAYNNLVYAKGGYVLHMLRFLMFEPKAGDADFIAMMKDFVTTYKDKNPSTEDFQAAVEKHMKPVMDVEGNHRMDWFFRAWLYGTEIPSYRLDYTIKEGADGKMHLKGTFAQTGVSKGFHMPAWLYVDIDGNLLRVGSLVVDGDSTREVNVVLPKRPRRVQLNAFHDVLARSVEVKEN